MKSALSIAALFLTVAGVPVGASTLSQSMGTAPVHAVQAVTKTVRLTFAGLTAQPQFSLAFGRDYSLQSIVCSGPNTCSVVVAFAPLYPGLSQDAILAENASGNVLATVLVYGIGLGPQSAFHPGLISTYAGSGMWGDSGDGSAATSASLSAPEGIAVDPLGNVYIADSVNQVVRKVTPAGIITTVAGEAGTPGSGGDGGPATSAQLNAPIAVALDGAGNLYIADSENGRIREVNAVTGIITTVAGGGAAASQTDGLGDGGPATAAILSGPNDVCVSPLGEIYIADTYHGLVRKVDSSGNIWIYAGGGSASGSDGYGDGGPATSASLATPSGLTLDPLGNLYISDTGHGLIRFVSAGVISAFATTPDPYGMRLDAAGDLFVTDSNDGVVREFLTGTGAAFIVAGTNGVNNYGGDGGSPLSAQLANPTAVALDPAGNLYIADDGNNRIRKITFSLQNLAFGSTYTGQASTPQTETLFNIGNQPLTVTNLSIDPGFTQLVSGATDCNNSISVSEGTNCVLQLALLSSTAGSVSGTLAVTTTSLNQNAAASAALSGTAVTPSAVVTATPTQISFGHQGVGTTSTSQTITFTNTSSLALTQQSIVTGPNASAFTISNSQCGPTLAASTPCSLQVTFNPTTPGSYTAAISFAYSGAAAVTIPLTGTGDPPQANLSTSSLAFGTIGQGATSSAQTVTLFNPSAAVLSISSISMSNAADFSFASGGTCTTSLAANASCSISVAFTPSEAGALSGSIVIADSAGITQSVALSGTALPALQFVPITPCRVVDTRNPAGQLGGPSIQAQSSRDFPVLASPCNIPSNAAAYSFNLTAVPHGFLAYVTMWPTGQPQPVASSINSYDGRYKAVATIVPAGTNGSVSVYAYNTTDIVLDINGYFVPKGTAGALAFYPVTPCRVADTRNTASPLGGPTLAAGQPRDLPILGSACNLPSTAQAYSLNFTAVPASTLPYLTVWPSGAQQPLTSVLNAPTGAVTANANLAPAGTNGDISVFAYSQSDLVVDVNGYFAPATNGGYSYFDVSPCRIVDTRTNGGSPVTELTVDVAGSSCGVPAAQAYAVNVTVVPNGTLHYITLWPYGQPQPVVSTLNAMDGTVTSNLAIVPANQGKISFFAYDATHVLVDILGFFE